MNALPELDADVLVVGAGPVGLSLAMDLSARGVRVAIAETRRYAEPPNVKCNHVSKKSCRHRTHHSTSNKVNNLAWIVKGINYPNHLA